MDVMSVTEVKQIPKHVHNRNQVCRALQSHRICLTDSDNYFILDKIKRRDNIEYDRDISVDDNDSYLHELIFNNIIYNFFSI